MSRNSFKELEKLEIEKLDNAVRRIKSKVNSNISVFNLFGDMSELFLPKILGLIVAMLGGKSDRNPSPKNKYPNLRG